MVLCLFVGLVLFRPSAHGQTVNSPDQDATADKVIGFPSKLFAKIQGKTASLDQQLTKQTEKYLQRMRRQETRLQKRLYKIDSAAAKRLFAGSSQQYAALEQRIRSDTGGNMQPPSGAYLANLDSEKVSLSFLQQHPELLGSGKDLSPALQGQLQGSVAQLQTLQAKMQDADQIQAFVQQRKQQIRQYLSQYLHLPAGLTSAYQGINQEQYYYAQQVEQYRQMLNDPDKMEKEALSLLDQLPAFQQFMKNNSQLSMLFGVPANAGTAQALAGLQTRDQLQQLLQGQLSAGGSNGMAALQQNLQSAQSQLGQYTDKLGNLGAGGGNVDMPDFKPNHERTRSFLHRLEFGTNLQTTQASNFFPATTDLGLSAGYRLNGNNTIGIGASYKMGWGTGFNHIALSGQGAGLRSFMDIKIKGGLSATGGLEYNYATPFYTLQQIRHLGDWTQSGLIGLSKTVSVKSKVFKKTSLQLLWDFLSYQQVPKTQPVLFRVGYGF